MIVVITSPDTLSLSMFTEYLRKNHLKDSVIVNLNGLLSRDIIMKVVDDALSRHPAQDIIFRHKTNKKLQPKKIPDRLFERADFIVGFDLYSTHAEVQKSCQGWSDSVVSSWQSYVDALNRV